jgi:hypothetical protein
LEGEHVAARFIDFHGARLAPPVENTIKGIRKALPPKLRPIFQDELDEAIDSADLQQIDRVKGKWWAQATLNADPTIREDFAALDRGELEAIPSPLAHL